MRPASTDRDAERPSPGWASSVAGSTVVTIIIVVIAMAVAIAAQSAPADTVIPSWNFQTSDGGWTSSWDGPGIAKGYKWTWTGTATPTYLTGGTSPHWHIRAEGMDPGVRNAYYLTSPLISGLSGTVPALSARISISHDFLLMMGGNGTPITAGQVQYRLNSLDATGTWSGLPLAAFTNGGSVFDSSIYGNSPFASGTTLRHVDQSGFVAPNYLTPTGTAALPYVTPGAAAFTGTTPLWPGDYYVPSQAFLDAGTGLPPEGIASLELRFTNLNVGANCGPYDGWNVKFVQVDFVYPTPPVPEPGSLALGATGLVVLATAGMIRHRRHQRRSRPSDSP